MKARELRREVARLRRAVSIAEYRCLLAQQALAAERKDMTAWAEITALLTTAEISPLEVAA